MSAKVSPDFDGLSVAPGLCATCDHARVLESATSAFLYCGLAAVDDRFPRYPRLPVVRCRGYHQRRGSEPSPSRDVES